MNLQRYHDLICIYFISLEQTCNVVLLRITLGHDRTYVLDHLRNSITSTLDATNGRPSAQRLAQVPHLPVLGCEVDQITQGHDRSPDGFLIAFSSSRFGSHALD